MKGLFFPAVLLVISLTIALCGGVVVDRSLDGRSDAEEESAESAKGKALVADAGEQASLKALRARVAELEKALAAAKAAAAPAEPEAPRQEAAVEGGETPRPNFGNPREWMDRLRKTDPARYAQMTNGIAKFRSDHFKRTANRLDLLASVDTSKWGREAQEVHTKYMDLMARREELMAMNLETADGESLRNAWQEGMELSRQLRELEKVERDNLLRETALGFGLDAADAGEFAQTIQNVIEVTSDFGGMRGPGRRGGGGPRGGRQR